MDDNFKKLNRSRKDHTLREMIELAGYGKSKKCPNCKTPMTTVQNTYNFEPYMTVTSCDDCGYWDEPKCKCGNKVRASYGEGLKCNKCI